ncbi:MAG: enoyl-CoA hydratase/isomerase family protein [Sulfitobacter sp.]
MSDQPDITVARAGPVGIIGLDRPQAMNALTLDMVRDIDRALDQFEADPAIDRVLLRSDTDRAFCAGGDMRRIRALSLAQNFGDAEQFFQEEYGLIQRMSGYAKTIIALVDGVCMGGGLGLVMQCDVRVATDRARFAMPETAIGFFPDVGGSYFLSRMPHFGAFWMGLTGAQVAGFDAQTLGISTHILPQGDVKGFESALGRPEAAMDTVLETFCAAPGYQSSMLSLAANTMCFDQSTLCSIKDRLSKHTAVGAQSARKALDKVSPRSLQETMRLLRRGRDASLKDCLAREFEAMQRAIRHPDLAEGVRAVLVEKDHAPCWQSSPALTQT